jgi:hypothetical protein
VRSTKIALRNIIDEAHSCQGGKATVLNAALTGAEDGDEAMARRHDLLGDLWSPGTGSPLSQ